MIKNILQLFILFVSTNVYSQITIELLDIETEIAIEDVLVSNSDNSIFGVSDANGFIQLDIKNYNDSLVFQHNSFETKVVNIKKYKNKSIQVYLIPKSIIIDVIVVSVDKHKEINERISNKVDVIELKTAKLLNPRTSADLLETTGNVFIQKSQGGGGSPIIRGFEANKVLLVVDGVRMNNAIYRGGHLQNAITIDESMLDRVEIVYGPGSLIYGSDALGGVVHFYTQKPKFSYSDKALVKANAMIRYASVNNEKTGHFDINVGANKFASLTSFSYSSFGDSKTGKNNNQKYGNWGKTIFYVENDKVIINENPYLQKRSGYNQIDLMQKFRYQENDYLNFKLNFQYSTSSNINRYDKLSVVKNKEVSDTTGKEFISAEQVNDSIYKIYVPKFADWYYGPQERLLVSFSAKSTKNTLLHNKASYILSYQYINESRYKQKFGKDILSSNIENLNIVTFNTDFRKDFKKNNRKTYLLYGIEFNYNLVNSSANNTNILTSEIEKTQTRYPDKGSVVFTSAIYGKYTHNFGEKIKLSAGLRLNNNYLHSKFSTRKFSGETFDDITLNNTAFSSSVNMVYVPLKQLQVNALISTGFRAPNVDDIGKIFDPNDQQIVIPNGNLKPEYTYNFELGFVTKIKEKTRIDLVGFYTILNNFIQREPYMFNGMDSVFVDDDIEKSQVLANVNSSNAFIAGASLNIKSEIVKNLNIIASLNYTYGLVEDKSPVSHIPPMFGRLALNYKYKKLKTSVYTKFSSWKHTWHYSPLSVDNFDEATEDGTPAWATLNFNTSYNFAKFYTATFAVENILDSHYRPFGSGISAAGRNFIFSLRASF